MSRISSSANRFYVGIEPSFGVPATITPTDRFPALGLHLNQTRMPAARLDRTGSRTSVNSGLTIRQETSFEIRTYQVSLNGDGLPTYGPLFEAACGSAPVICNGLVVHSYQGIVVETITPHNQAIGGAISYAGEIRFITAIPNERRFQLNAPFTDAPGEGTALQPTVTYRLGMQLPSITVYDYWDPITATSRAAVGSVVNAMEIAVGGTFHEITFSGFAADLIDSTTNSKGASGVHSLPSEPPIQKLTYSIVTGQLGAFWIGGANQFVPIMSASISLRNHLRMRNREYGSLSALAATPGKREVVARFTTIPDDNTSMGTLYLAAHKGTPLPLMLQCGSQQGQLMAVFIPQAVGQLPVFDSQQAVLAWEFSNMSGTGVADDELYLAFA